MRLKTHVIIYTFSFDDETTPEPDQQVINKWPFDGWIMLIATEQKWMTT